jgi:hypothetical protein
MAMLRDPGVGPQEALLLLTPGVVQNAGYRLVHVKAKTRIQEDGRPVEAEFVEATLDSEAFARLEVVWRSMTGGARWQRRNEVLRVNPAVVAVRPPTLFRFDYWGNHSFSQGVTSSPEPGSCSADLVAVTDTLIQMTSEDRERERGPLREVLLRRLAALAKRMQGTDPDPCSDGACHSR